jgi:hypothetical protein
MKTNKVVLTKWLPIEGEYIEIDWPKVQQTIGREHLEWLLRQSKSQCQLILERNDMHCTLVADFYDERLLTCYHLMWAK